MVNHNEQSNKTHLFQLLDLKNELDYWQEVGSQPFLTIGNKRAVLRPQEISQLRECLDSIILGEQVNLEGDLERISL